MRCGAGPDLYAELERSGDGIVDGDEITRTVNAVAVGGVAVIGESFLERWDLDGDGRVTEEELPAVAWDAARTTRPALTGSPTARSPQVLV